MKALATEEGAIFMEEYANPFRLCFFPIFRTFYQYADDNNPRSRTDVVSLISTVALKCIKYRESNRLDIFGMTSPLVLVVQEGLLRFSTCKELPAPAFVTQTDFERALPKTDLKRYIGGQGRKVGTEVLHAPNTVRDCVQRAEYFLAQVVHEKMNDWWDDRRPVPAAINPSLSEGICALMKNQWAKGRNRCMRDEVLRAFCVAARSKLSVPAELREDKGLVSSLRSMTLRVQRGQDRNSKASDVRLEELDVTAETTRARREKRVAKHNELVEVPFVRDKKELEKMTLKELQTQAKLQGMKLWFKHNKPELLRRVGNIANRRRYTRRISVDDEELLVSSCGDKAGSESEDSSSPPPTQVPDRRVSFGPEIRPLIFVGVDDDDDSDDSPDRGDTNARKRKGRKVEGRGKRSRVPGFVR